MASSPLNKIYDEARHDDMLRQARQAQLVANLEQGRVKVERRPFNQRVWFWRHRKSAEVPTAPAVTPS